MRNILISLAIIFTGLIGRADSDVMDTLYIGGGMYQDLSNNYKNTGIYSIDYTHTYYILYGSLQADYGGTNKLMVTTISTGLQLGPVFIGPTVGTSYENPWLDAIIGGEAGLNVTLNDEFSIKVTEIESVHFNAQVFSLGFNF